MASDISAQLREPRAARTEERERGSLSTTGWWRLRTLAILGARYGDAEASPSEERESGVNESIRVVSWQNSITRTLPGSGCRLGAKVRQRELG